MVSGARSNPNYSDSFNVSTIYVVRQIVTSSFESVYEIPQQQIRRMKLALCLSLSGLHSTGVCDCVFV